MIRVFFLLIAITAIHLFTENSGAEWSKVYERAQNSTQAQSIRVTNDGGYIVAGGYGDYSILKLYSNGALEWQRMYTIEPFDEAMSIQQTAEGGYIVAGISDHNYLNEKLWILKLNTDGDSEWQKTYINDEYISTEGYDIQQTVDVNMNPDGYIAVGFGADTSSRIWVLRLNLDGSLDWQKSYAPGGGAGRSIRQTFDPDGSPSGYVLAGNNNYGLWVIKLNIDGSIGWERTYNYLGITRNIYCIRQISGGNYIAVGSSRTALNSSNDVLVVRLASDGAIIWHRSYGGEEGDVGYEVLESRDDQNSPDGFVVVGFTESFGMGQKDAWIFKLDGDGNLQWQKTYGGSNDDIAHSLDKAHGGGFILAGSTWSFGTAIPTNRHLWVLQINEQGDIPFCSSMGPSQASASLPDINDPETYTPVVSISEPTVTTTNAAVETTGYIMTPICSLAGDFNMDDTVDESDLEAFVPGFGATDCGSSEPCTGDIDSDDDMDGKDLSILARNNGRSN